MYIYIYIYTYNVSVLLRVGPRGFSEADGCLAGLDCAHCLAKVASAPLWSALVCPLRRSGALLRPLWLHKSVSEAIWAPFWDPPNLKNRAGSRTPA